MQTKTEKFFVPKAKELKVTFEYDIIDLDITDEYILSCIHYLSDKGFDGDFVDYEVDGNTYSMYVSLKDNFLICEQDFRGFPLRSGDLISLDDKSVEAMNSADTYGLQDFRTQDSFNINSVIYRDSDGSVEYYLDTYITPEEPIVICRKELD